MFHSTSIRRAFGLTTPTTPGNSGDRPDPFDNDLNTRRTTNLSEESNPPSDKELPSPPYGSDDPSSPLKAQDLNTSKINSSPVSPSDVTLDPDDADRRRRRRLRRQDALSTLQPIGESSSSFSAAPASTPFRQSVFAHDESHMAKMEQIGKLRRLQSQQRLNSPAAPKLDLPAASTSAQDQPSDSTSPIKDIPLDDSPSQPSTEPIVNPLPTPPDESPPTTTEQHLREELEALKNLLDVTVAELDAAKAEVKRVKREHTADKARLSERLKATEKDNARLVKENSAQLQIIEGLKSELATTHSTLSSLAREKRGWQEKVDKMHLRLHRAERQVRCLDHVTRAKLDARQENLSRLIKRGTQHVAKGPSPEVIGAITALNEEILQMANLFVENLERTGLRGVNHLGRASDVVGEGMSAMMEIQAEDRSPKFRLLLMQVVLEVFMVHWTSAIIEGWYPKQQSFADVLLELAAQATGGSSTISCGKPIKIVQTHSTTATQAKFAEWTTEILNDLSQILLVGGLRMRSQRANLFSTNTLNLVKLAYDLRSAFAEKDLCGGVDLSLVAPDTIFQQKWMEESHLSTRTRGQSAPQMERVAGTSGLGLQISANTDKWRSTTAPIPAPTIVIKPKIVLLRVLQENP